MPIRGIDPFIAKRIESWLNGPYDAKTQEEIRSLLLKDPKGLSDAFFQDLSFGTGGMRGLLGVGTNRMNLYTIRKATQALASYLKKQPFPSFAVFIGYDVRHQSKEFAQEAASVLTGNSIRVFLTKEICPTPLVSFGCRYFGCQAAIMITASHNPPQYNGYKVYWQEGAQVVAPHDLGIMEESQAVSTIELGPLEPPLVHFVGKELDRAYLTEMKKLQLYPEFATSKLHIVYSPLHGTGIRLMQEALKSWGYPSVSLVEKQSTQDPDFSFAPSPNPEEKKALFLGEEQLEKEKGDLLIATDPDADRVGVAIRGSVRFTGNQIAALLLEHICQALQKKELLPLNGAVIKTIVTTELFKKIATSFGVQCVEVLTGFKYISEKIAEWEKSFGGYQYLFGAEESYGYLYGTFVRDKDAISTACLIAEMSAKAKQENLTLQDVLYRLYKKHGIHRESLTNISFQNGQKGMQEMKQVMDLLRKDPPKNIANVPIVSIEDYRIPQNGLPASDVLRFWLEDGSKLVIRPSGTEPKLKIYAEVIESASFGIEEGIAISDKKLKNLLSDFQSTSLGK